MLNLSTQKFTKYYSILIFAIIVGFSCPASAQDYIINKDGVKESGTLKNEETGFVKIKTDNGKKNKSFDAVDIKGFYNAETNMTFVSRKALNADYALFFPVLENVNGAFAYSFENGELEVLPCGDIKVYKFKTLGPEEIHGGRIEYTEIYLENEKLGPQRVYGNDMKDEEQIKVLMSYSNGSNNIDLGIENFFKVNPKMEFLMAYLNVKAKK